VKIRILYANHERYLILTTEVLKLKSVWEASRGPDVPQNANDIASKLLDDAKAEYQKNKKG
jgi:hypothetical protein